jgi:uncharacterized membrane protein YtjA (UPF0391 family)
MNPGFLPAANVSAPRANAIGTDRAAQDYSDGRGHQRKGDHVTKIGLGLIGVALVAGLLGFAGYQGASVGAAQLLFVFDIALLAITGLFSLARKNSF